MPLLMPLFRAGFQFTNAGTESGTEPETVYQSHNVSGSERDQPCINTMLSAADCTLKRVVGIDVGGHAKLDGCSRC